MSELLDKQVNAQKEKISRAPASTHVKVCNENENKEKMMQCKNVIDGRKPFTRRIQKTGENHLHELQVNDYGYNEGTICLVNG